MYKQQINRTNGFDRNALLLHVSMTRTNTPMELVPLIVTCMYMYHPSLPPLKVCSINVLRFSMSLGYLHVDEQ